MLQFFREIPIRVLIEKASAERRGFFFYVAAGFHKQLDPLSGMTVNLVDVDLALSHLKQTLESESFADLAHVVTTAAKILNTEATRMGALLTKIEFREERNFSILWEQKSSEVLCYKYNHYMEDLNPALEWDLFKISLTWAKAVGCTDDLQYEGVKILKQLPGSSPAKVREYLGSKLGFQLQSGSWIKAVHMQSLGQDFTLSASV
jgi:hypothetical protein